MDGTISARPGPLARPVPRQPWYKVLYIQVLIAIALGILVGYVYPETAKSFKWLGDAFVALIKMMIAPVIFCTIVHGISSMGDLRKVGRVGITVNAVAPGFVETELTGSLDDGQREQIAKRSALKRLAAIEDVAKAVGFLMSDAARNITGTILTVDAGNTA